MTTKEAADQYEAEHVKMYIGKKVAVCNPKNRPIADLMEKMS